MKKLNSFCQVLLVVLLINLSVFAKLHATDYTISFTASGATTTISSVEVQNLTQSTSVIVPEGTPVLLIGTGTTAAPYLTANSRNLKIYPNPITEKSVVSFFSELGGKTDIAVYGMDGRTIIHTTKDLPAGENRFRLSLPQGVFSMHINVNGILYFGTVVSQSMNKAELDFLGIYSEPAAAKQIQKVRTSATDLGYSNGDNILLKGYSDDFCTIVTIKPPTKDTTVNFNFVECRDAEGYNYPVVQIGDQVWMAENLKTTRYRNGDAIGTITGAMPNDATSKYQWAYNGDENNVAKYGRLYTWYAATDSRNIAPAGWHVPTDAEWTILENYLIANGYNYDGTTTGNKIAKALAATTDWNTYTGSGTIGNDLTKNNSSGFTALPGGYRGDGGAFYGIGGYGYWWSSTEYGASYAGCRSLGYYDGSLSSYDLSKYFGFSVRCIKDETINPLNIETALIPAGTFTMGSPETEVNSSFDETQHQVTLSAFRMSKYEITNAQFAAFLNAKGIGSDGLYAAGTYPTQTLIFAYNSFGLIYSGTQWVPVAGYENNPVIRVTWYGATEYATYAGGTLPTEAQWEYACRAGTITPFNTGDCLTNLQANYYWAYPYSTCTNTVSTLPGRTQPVGSYTPNAWGLYDMHGNVWEWCSDWYGTYPTTAQTNPTGAATGSYRVIRGGSWDSYAQFCRSAGRGGTYPYDGSSRIGFRVVFVP